MKKLLLFLFLGWAVAFSFGQNRVRGNGKVTTQTRNISGYSGVVLKGSLDVVLTSKEQGKITISAEENIIPIITTKIVNGNLEISFKENISVSYKKGATVYVPSTGVNKIELSGSGDIENQDILKTQLLTLHLRGSGDIKLNVSAASISAQLIGSGDMELKGNTKDFNIDLRGSGDVSAYQLSSQKVEATLVGSGDIEVNASSHFKGDVKGSGDIKVKGNPFDVEKKIKGSGTIKIL